MSSRSVKALRERYGTAGNKSDRSDAYVLADCLRTDGHRWRSMQPDSPATVTIRTHVRARKDLVETRVAVANQLRAHLRIVFPGAVGLFRDIDSPISLRFLERFPSATKAAWLLVGAPWGINWAHLQGAGALALMIMAVMTRAALGHTGRDLVAAPPIVVAYALLPLAALVRAFGPRLCGNAMAPLAVAAALWIAAFALFLLVYAPILLRPRPDGKPG